MMQNYLRYSGKQECTPQQKYWRVLSIQRLLVLLVCLTEKASALRSNVFPKSWMDEEGRSDDFLSHDHHLLLLLLVVYLNLVYV